MDNKDPESDDILKQLHKALEAGDPEKAIERVGDLITLGVRRGEIDQATSQRMRLELCAEMIKATSRGPAREKVTLSLPTDVLRALRLAGAESNKDMSEVVTEALRKELKLEKYPHASQVLLK